jgi:hypothetical protein
VAEVVYDDAQLDMLPAAVRPSTVDTPAGGDVVAVADEVAQASSGVPAIPDAEPAAEDRPVEQPAVEQSAVEQSAVEQSAGEQPAAGSPGE